MIGEMTPEAFLSTHWQRRPALLRGAMPDVRCPLSADELAGLACDSEVESRLVSGSTKAGFHLEHGPFEASRFERLPDVDWTLLVQDLDKHVRGLESLLARFRFLPEWRIDDVMASYAAPGGSVGPHCDQYDVFLVQALGTRRWQWSERFDPSLRDDCELGVLSRFEPEEDAVLAPGDVLYLPPGVAHFGVAQEPCITLSVGFRAPDQKQLTFALVEELAERANDRLRFRDAGRAPVRSPLELARADREQLRMLMTEALSLTDAQLDDFLGRHLTAPKPHLETMTDPDELLTPRTVRERLTAGEALERRLGSRWLSLDGPDGSLLYVNGRGVPLSEHELQLVAELGAGRRLLASDLAPDGSASEELLSELVGLGALSWSH